MPPISSQAAAQFEAESAAEIRTLPPSLWDTTLLGLLFAYVALFSSAPGAVNSFLLWAGLSTDNSWGWSQILLDLMIGAAVLSIVVYLERRPLSSLGLKRPTWSDLGLALALLTAVFIVEGIFGFAVRVLFPKALSNVATEQVKRMFALPFGLSIAIALTAGLVEEIKERGFVLTRLDELSGSVWLAGGLVFVLSVSAHIPYWGWRYAAMIAPGELLLVLMYMWRRDLAPNIIAHTLMDSWPTAMRLATLAAMTIFGYSGFHQGLASMKFQRENYKGAIAEYSLALQARPHDAELLHDRARAEIYDRNYAGAILDLDEVLAHNPKDLAALTDRSQSYLDAGHYEMALRDADQAVASAPTDGDTYSSRAYVYDHMAKYDEAISDLNQAIKLARKKDADLFYRRGFVYLQKSDWEHAVGDFTNAKELNPGDLYTVEERARAYSGEKKPELALKDWNRAIEINPANYWAYLQRAYVHQQRGQYQLASNDLTKAVSLAADDSESANALAWLLSTCPDSKIRDSKLALKYGNHACDLTEWKDWQLIDTLAAAYAEAGNFAEAASWQSRALDLARSAPADDQKHMRERLALYQNGKPYREPPPR